MNYADFYTSAQKMLIDSMVSIWFRGQAEEQKYMRHILEEEEPLLSEPVFQSIFPWEESKENFGEHESKLKILTSSFVNALSSENVEEDLRFPLDRHPYKHQTKSWKTMLSGEDKTIVVTSGTGSGKTECFMIPVLQDIAQRNEKNCVQAIFLYPLNALMKSQQKRIHAWCNAIPEKITYAIYNGDTEKSARSTSFTAPYYPQLITRPQIRQTPPQILFTNPTMLNYMLVRSEDREILEKSKGKLKWILLDEAHTYTGSSATELALQLRRVLDAFGVTIHDVNFAVTSATIGDEKDPNTELKLKTFVSQLTGKPVNSIVVIGGKRIIPEMDVQKATNTIEAINTKFGTHITISDIERLRKKLNSSPVLSTKDIVKQLDSVIAKDTTKSLQIIDALGNKVDGLNKCNGNTAALLPSRAHYFIRSISGVYACVNPNCSRHKKIRIGLGNLTTYQNINCPTCKSKMLEVATCPSCGGAIIVGETSTSKGYRMHTNTINLDNSIFYETNENEDLIESEDGIANDNQSLESDGFTPFYFAKPKARCLRHHTTEDGHVFNHDKGKIEIAENNADQTIVYKSLRHTESGADLCPHCGNTLGKLNYLRASATQMGRVLSTLILDNAEGTDKKDTEILYNGKKYISFTDNRQGSARFAMGLNQDVERSWVRASIFHKLADMRLDEVETAGLTEDEEKTYIFLKGQPSLPPMMVTELKRLEAKKQGNNTVPEAPEVAWADISQTLENNADFRKLFYHLSNARGGFRHENTATYLKALLVDQFGWIPKRANSLENMGVVRLVYPDLKKAKCPALLISKGCQDEDWQIFLKICLDYLIRGGKHYMISGEYRDFLTQNANASAIYPCNSQLRKNGNPVSRWPSVKTTLKGVQEEQSRLVLLLCAALGYDDVESFNEEKIANINGLLNDAWSFITSNILEPVDIGNRGYMLDLLGSKVKIQLVDKGYLCPVDNVVVDVKFCGFSPRIHGYIGKANFDRYRIKEDSEFQYPYFPFKSDEQNEDEVSQWIADNFSKQKESCVFSDIHERIYVQKPIFISAEHSAQQSRDDLDKYEKQFNDGHLNILSCSTTMEMGVDIGGISEVVMNNVPPKSANYLQRAGRAGRRNESKALALTFCAPNPIGSHTWSHPEYPITHITETPLLKFESRQLIQRHVNALVFADFVSKQAVIRVTSQLSDFFTGSDEISYFDRFMTHIDMVIGGQCQHLDEPYYHLTKGTILENVSIGDAVYATKKDILNVKNIFSVHLESLNKSLETLRNEDGNVSATRAIEGQKNNFLNTSLLQYLAENAFLPSAGIPTGLVECMLGLNDDSNYPTMHLSQAISAYAPGSKVVKNEWIYEPTGIRLKTKYESNTSRYVLQNCTSCGYTTINYGNAMNHCPKCGAQDSMHGIKDMSLALEQRFTEVVEPAAFTVAWGTKPTRKMNGIGSMSFIQPVLLEMDPWQERTSSAKMTVRCSTSRSEILFYNRGRNGFGYEFCPYCGKMESEKKIDSTEPVLSGHKHLTTGTPCPGGALRGSGVRRHVLLVGRYQTDFVEIKFYNSDNCLETDPETLYSLGVILSRKLTELLGVNDGEIDFGYNAGSHSIFIYDTALGGAGYSPLFREYKDTVLEMAYESLKKCDCERSCTKCLIDRQSQWYLNYLNRPKALNWLEVERKCRVAPTAIRTLIPNATSVTTDIATEIYQLSRNKNIKNIRFFVDSNYSLWKPSEFPYIKLMSELSLEGVDATFVLNKGIDVANVPSSVRTLLMSALFQYKFNYCTDSMVGSFKPLLSVTFNDGRVITYFGEDINTTLSSTWGNGDIYSTSDENFTFSNIDVVELLQSIADGDDSIMFDARIKEDCYIHSLLDTLTRIKADNWSKIRSAFNGKTVSIEYSDRYLITPLGCMLLAHIISSIKNYLEVNIRSINVSVTKPVNNNSYETRRTNIDNNFCTSIARNEFLKDSINELVSVIPTINDNGYIEHERCLTVKTHSEELCIRPDAGIANGWKPFGKEYLGCSDENFRDDWNLEMKLFNQKKTHSGILYTISYNKY